VEEMSIYDVRVQRSGRTWSLYVPQVDRYTQARHLREVDDMARDLIAVMDGIDPGDITLNIDIEMPADVRAHLDKAAELRMRAESVRRQASAEHHAAARALRERGLTVRDIGRILGVSYQRAHQLISDSATRAA
jgi:hypothetical protein